VGKSSLINALLSETHTKVSKTPGKTNFLQFIYIPVIGITIVDCPGYGKAQRSLKERKEWNKMIQQYISGSK
jgi:GTP-binding protein